MAVFGKHFFTKAFKSQQGDLSGTDLITTEQNSTLTREVNEVTTVAASSGVKLPVALTSSRIIVFNDGANTLNVYPPDASGNIEGLGAGVADTIAAGAYTEYIKSATNVWRKL